MREIALTVGQKMELETRHKQSRDSRESDRIKAIILRAEGWPLDSIAQALRKHVSSIARHIDDYLSDEKLASSNGGSTSKLNSVQTEELIKHLTEHTYTSQQEIVAYIQQRWSVQYSIPGLNKWLHKNGFSYKKPKSMPYKVDLEKQKQFIEDYEQLKASIPEDEAIFFMDAVHPTQATKVSAGWIKTGEDKPILTTGSRTRLNIVGALRLGYIDETVSAQYPTVNGEAIIDFMGKLRGQHPEMGFLHLVLDGAGYHKSAVVIEAAETLNIHLHFLPPYSPNLNPIERLWKVMNEKVRNNHCFHSAKEFRQRIDEFFEEILPDIGRSLDTRINDNFQVFDHALSG